MLQFLKSFIIFGLNFLFEFIKFEGKITILDLFNRFSLFLSKFDTFHLNNWCFRCAFDLFDTNFLTFTDRISKLVLEIESRRKLQINTCFLTFIRSFLNLTIFLRYPSSISIITNPNIQSTSLFLKKMTRQILLMRYSIFWHFQPIFNPLDIINQILLLYLNLSIVTSHLMMKILIAISNLVQNS